MCLVPYRQRIAQACHHTLTLSIVGDFLMVSFRDKKRENGQTALWAAPHFVRHRCRGQVGDARDSPKRQITNEIKSEMTWTRTLFFSTWSASLTYSADVLGARFLSIILVIHKRKKPRSSCGGHHKLHTNWRQEGVGFANLVSPVTICSFSLHDQQRIKVHKEDILPLHEP